MAQYIKQGNIFGRIGENLGKGLAEQLPKDVERGRLSAGLKHLGEQKGQTPFQQFAGLASLAHDKPQIIQSGTDLLRQQSILDSLNSSNNQELSDRPSRPYEEPGLRPQTATTTGSTEAALSPYIPPSGPEQEQMARRLMQQEPQIYRDIDSARSAISNQIAGNTNQSNARLAKRELEESVQNKSEQGLRGEIETLGAKIPGKVISSLQQRAVEDVTSKRLSIDEAKIKYGKEADKISRDFSNISSWGNISLITKDPKDLLRSIKAIQGNAKKGGYQKEAADALIADNGLTPQFAHALLYPVSDIKSLNDELKSLENIKPRLEKSSSAPGLAGIGFSRPNNANPNKMTLEVSPRLARAMGTEGSPLSIGYELERKGYDPEVWKQYILDHKDDLNLTSYQIDELQKPKPSFFGLLNDWWLKSFSGVK